MIKTLWKKTLCTLCFIGLILVGATSAKAEAVNRKDADIHYDYLKKFYTSNQERYAVDAAGQDITTSFLYKTEDMFYQGNIEKIFEIMKEEEIVLHLLSSEKVFEEGETYAYSRYKTVESDVIEFVLSDQYDNTTLYVQAELTGGIWYNETTSEVTDVTSATYNILSTDCNGSWEILTNNFSTGSNVINGKGYFWGQCQFLGQGQSQSEDGIVIPINLDYGTKRVEFYAIP